MPLRQLGQSELMVSPIGLGVWQFSEGKGWGGSYWPAVSRDEMRDIVATALNGGINWFDTAEMYGGGASERSLARALAKLDRDQSGVILATKWLPLLRTAGHLESSIGQRLAALNTSVIDLYQIHQPWSFSSVEAQMAAMAHLVQAGQVRAVGVSNFSAERMRRAHQALQSHGLALASNQMEYNLLNRDIERNGVLETARELGVSIIAYSPLAQGLLTGKFHDDPDRLKGIGIRRFRPPFWRRNLEKSRPVIETLRRVGQRSQATAAQVALAWLIQAQGDLVVAIPGASKARHAQANAEAMKVRLTDEDLHDLDEVSRAYGA